MTLEQEMKLSVLGDDVDLTQLVFDGYQQSEITRQRLISTYFDTPDLTLLSKKMGLRLRHDGNQWFQTVKESGHVKNGLHQRQEWEEKVITNQFDIPLLQQTPLSDLIEDEAIWPKVFPLFTTNFIRQTIILTSDDQTEIELAYDKGSISNEENMTPIHEIELELKRGGIRQLQLLSAQVMTQLSLKATDKSKAQHGYALCSTKVQL